MAVRTIPIIILIALGGASCARQRDQVHQFLGDHAIAVLSQPQRVEVYRITGGLRPAPTTNASAIAGYPIIEHDPDQDAAFGRELAKLFLSPDAYNFNGGKACIFQPDTLLRIHGPDGWVDLVLCFHCRQFEMTSYDNAGTKIHSGSQEFDGVRDQLAGLVQRATGVAPYHD